MRNASLFIGTFITASLALSFSPIGNTPLPNKNPPAPSVGYRLICPDSSNVVLKDNILLLVLKVDTSSIAPVKIYAPWDSLVHLEFPSASNRSAIVSETVAALPPELIVKTVAVSVQRYHQPVQTDVNAFRFSENVSGKNFFLNDTTRKTLKLLRDGGTPSATVEISGWIPISIMTKERRDGFCQGEYIAVPVFLQPGKNVIPIETFSSQGMLASRDSVAAFYELDIDAASPSPDFERFVFHTAEREAACTGCHGTKSDGPTALRCESCHGAISKQKAVHGPASTNDCSTCHNDKPGSGYTPIYKNAKEADACFTCHDDILSATKKASLVHAPVAAGGCTVCHSPHGSPNSFQLRKPVNSLCTSCHDDKRDGDHPVVFHPVGGKPDPRDPSKTLSCVSCHNPHASDNKYLLTVQGGYFALCQSCHKM